MLYVKRFLHTVLLHFELQFRHLFLYIMILTLSTSLYHYTSNPGICQMLSVHSLTPVRPYTAYAAAYPMNGGCLSSLTAPAPLSAPVKDSLSIPHTLHFRLSAPIYLSADFLRCVIYTSYSLWWYIGSAGAASGSLHPLLPVTP